MDSKENAVPRVPTDDLVSVKDVYEENRQLRMEIFDLRLLVYNYEKKLKETGQLSDSEDNSQDIIQKYEVQVAELKKEIAAKVKCLRKALDAIDLLSSENEHLRSTQERVHSMMEEARLQAQTATEMLEQSRTEMMSRIHMLEHQQHDAQARHAMLMEEQRLHLTAHIQDLEARLCAAQQQASVPVYHHHVDDGEEDVESSVIEEHHHFYDDDFDADECAPCVVIPGTNQSALTDDDNASNRPIVELAPPVSSALVIVETGAVEMEVNNSHVFAKTQIPPPQDSTSAFWDKTSESVAFYCERAQVEVSNASLKKTPEEETWKKELQEVQEKVVYLTEALRLKEEEMDALVLKLQPNEQRNAATEVEMCDLQAKMEEWERKNVELNAKLCEITKQKDDLEGMLERTKSALPRLMEKIQKRQDTIDALQDTVEKQKEKLQPLQEGYRILERLLQHPSVAPFVSQRGLAIPTWVDADEEHPGEQGDAVAHIVDGQVNLVLALVKEICRLDAPSENTSCMKGELDLELAMTKQKRLNDTLDGVELALDEDDADDSQMARPQATSSGQLVGPRQDADATCPAVRSEFPSVAGLFDSLSSQHGELIDQFLGGVLQSMQSLHSQLVESVTSETENSPEEVEEDQPSMSLLQRRAKSVKGLSPRRQVLHKNAVASILLSQSAMASFGSTSSLSLHLDTSVNVTQLENCGKDIIERIVNKLLEMRRTLTECEELQRTLGISQNSQLDVSQDLSLALPSMTETGMITDMPQYVHVITETVPQTTSEMAVLTELSGEELFSAAQVQEFRDQEHLQWQKQSEEIAKLAREEAVAELEPQWMQLVWEEKEKLLDAKRKIEDLEQSARETQQSMSEELEQLRAKSLQMESRTTSLQEEVEWWSERMTEMEAHLAQSEQDCQQAMTERSALAVEVENTKEMLQATQSRLELKVHELQETCSTLEEERATILKQLQDSQKTWKEKVAQLEASVELWRGDLVLANAEKEDIRMQLKAVDKECQIEKEAVKQLQRQCHEKEGVVSALEQQLKQAAQMSTVLKSSEEKLAAKSSDLEAANIQITRLKTLQSEMIRKLETQLEEMSKMTVMIGQKNEHIANLEKEVRRLRPLAEGHNDVAKLEKQKEQLTEKCLAYRKRCHELQDAMKRREQEMEQMLTKNLSTTAKTLEAARVNLERVYQMEHDSLGQS